VPKEGADLLKQLGSGNRIQSACLVAGQDRLVIPS